VYQRGKRGATLQDVPAGEPGGDVVSLNDRRPMARQKKAEAWVRYCENCT